MRVAPSCWIFADSLRERILAPDLIAEADFAALKERRRRHIENPDTLVVHGPYVQAWGRKPE